MTKTKNKQKRLPKPQTTLKPTKEERLTCLEFHRHAYALVPDKNDPKPGIAFFVEKKGDQSAFRFCTCSESAKKTCKHILNLVKAYKSLTIAKASPHEAFKSSIWFKLATVLADGDSTASDSVQIRSSGKQGNKSESVDLEKTQNLINVFSPKGELMLSCFTGGDATRRFIERCTAPLDEKDLPHRATILKRLTLLTMTENERVMSKRGFKTRGRVLEESFWYRLAYHGFQEFGTEICSFQPAIETATGAFTITCIQDASESPIMRIVVPGKKVKALIQTLGKALPNQHQIPIHPIPLKSLFKVTPTTEMDLELLPLIQVIQQNGEKKYYESKDLDKYRYGSLVYIPELKMLAEMERPGGKERKFASPVKMVLKKSQIPGFLDDAQKEIESGSLLLSREMRRLKIYRTFDKVEISPDAIERDWCWISVNYGFGSQTISLHDILDARKTGARYLNTPEGWVDCRSNVFDVWEMITKNLPRGKSDRDHEVVKLPVAALFRLKALNNQGITFTGDKQKISFLENIFTCRPISAPPTLKGMTSKLRPYQFLGVEWLRFLYENGFGGLLCDDMGLGKTHQVMALILGLQELGKIQEPVLVVCPTSVISHWAKKIQEHIPTVNATVYYGGDRDLESAIKNNRVLITSYGIMRNDIERLKKILFEVAIFDEIQHIKNRATLGHDAATEIQSKIKLGLTGTPVENSLMDLKALFDLVLPGYLGGDSEFAQHYQRQIENDPGGPVQQEFSRMIHPFVLRRLKQTVLKDLPEKIEDLRTCTLSQEQLKLYRDAIESRGKGLLAELHSDKKPVPYIHIFALLTLLKQICNHPAMLNGGAKAKDKTVSGKWELFKELLSESLDSGQKVVIYSQFVKMIEIIEAHLREIDVDYSVLTGKSRNRGDLIERFNENPNCRVFLGSLKAGGTGIDLVAGSVVIHYDRWWNAAREDQATDRVHRIGQKRGVQVFKLVTEGTLEEKISAIIEKKRNLMDRIVKEDDPGLLKTFSREELVELLSEPS